MVEHGGARAMSGLVSFKVQQQWCLIYIYLYRNIMKYIAYNIRKMVYTHFRAMNWWGVFFSISLSHLSLYVPSFVQRELFFDPSDRAILKHQPAMFVEKSSRKSLKNSRISS